MTNAPHGGGADRSAPRIVLVTGLGGAGRTTVAAATALVAGAPAARTLLLSTEEAGVLDPVLGARVPAGAPAEVAPGLWAARTDPDAEMLTLAAVLRERAGAFWQFTGAAPLDDDEVTPLPGAAEFALLRALRAATTGTWGAWETVVVDLPPLPAALRALALPEQAGRCLDRLLPPRKQAARALRPLLADLAGVPMPADGLYTAADGFRRELAAVADVLRSARTSVRLVAEPGPLALEPLGTARAALALFGLRLEAVIANRVLPADGRDPLLARLSGEQQSALKALRACEVLELPHLGRSPRGSEDLAVLGAECAVPDGAATGTGDQDGAGGGPAGAPPGPSSAHVVDRLAADGRLHWRCALPGARKETLGLVRRGDELLLGVGPHRRAVTLPSALRRCHVVGAAYEEGVLSVRFEPDPAVWPARPS